MAERPILVKATHAYTPLNNDELKLEQGEILTVTQKEEGGWWEGTLGNGKTGWFPSNYVEDIGLGLSSSVSLSSLGNGSSHSGTGKLNTSISQDAFGSQNSFSDLPALTAQQAEYRKVAFLELLDSETSHVQELQVFWDSYMLPLQKSDLMSPGEFKIIGGNLTEIIHFHLNAIISPLKLEQAKNTKDQRVGSLFLDNATRFEELHKIYCSNHPKAVQVIEKYKEQLSAFIESKGARKPGILHIITLLSQPFRRLEKYPTLLQEIERHVEEFHKDRGDLQRSIEYYKEVQKTCSALRKQKEMELEVLSGAIKDWEGADVSQLGDIVFMNLVHLGYERLPRYLVLFPNTLLILSYNTETNTLVYEGKVPVTGITLKLLDQEALANAFEIAGPMIDSITVSCTSKSIRDLWLDHLNIILKSNRLHSFSGSPQQSFGQLTAPVQAWNIARLRPAPPFNPFLSEYLTSLKKLRQSTRQEPASASASTTSLNLNSQNQNGKNGNLNLNRSASTGGGFLPSAAANFSYNFSPAVTNEDDFAVLSLVDSFCTKNRHTVTSSSSIFPFPPPIDPNSKHPGSPMPMNVNVNPKAKSPPRTLAQLVLSLQEDVSTLKLSMEEEQRRRQALQSFVQKSLSNSNINNSVFGNTSGNSGPTSLPSSMNSPSPPDA